jgi:hypothetical protein
VSLLKVTKSGTAGDLSLLQMGSNDQTQQDYLGYRFTFNLTPYPKAGNSIPDSDYRLALKVTSAEK